MPAAPARPMTASAASRAPRRPACLVNIRSSSLIPTQNLTHSRPPVYPQYDDDVATTAKQTALDPHDFLAIDTLLDDEEKAIRDTVRTFVRERVVPNVGEWFEQGVLPRELAQEVARLGLFGMHL